MTHPRAALRVAHPASAPQPARSAFARTLVRTPLTPNFIAASADPTSARGRFGPQSSPLRSARRPSGFTLIEVLVALTIMAVMAMLTWRGIDGMARAQESTRRYTDDVLALQAGLSQWRADLDAMMVWPVTDGSPPYQTSASQRSLSWDGRLLRITRASAGEPAGGLRVVAWTRRPDGQWLRWQSAPFLSQNAWKAAWDNAENWSHAANELAAEGTGAQAVRVANATEWQVHYFRNNAWTNPLSSGAESAAAVGTLPDGVRLLINFAPGQAINGPMVLDWVRPNFGGAS
ncbi:PulJ/GspJ family protein [Ottowia oryzae]